MSIYHHPDSNKPVAVFMLDDKAFRRIYGPKEREAIPQLTRLLEPVLNERNWRQHPEVCRQAEVIFSGWGMPVVNAELLAAFPNLKAIFYGAGSVKGFITDELWQRGVLVSSAYVANAIPVSEYTVAQIVLSTKRAWQLAAYSRQNKSFPAPPDRESPGMYGETTIGLISLGTIGRLVARRLQSFQVRLIAYDPMIDPLEAADMQVRLCSLEELFKQAHVVSCHTPLLPATAGMIRSTHFESMRQNATFINTARGAIIDEAGMIEALRRRPDLWALLDVSWPIPPRPDSPLYTLPNVFLTPHIAGSMGEECRRLGWTMIEECKRYLTGTPLQYAIRREQALVMA